jgi:choice-of-anchor B domain-containing protein
MLSKLFCYTFCLLGGITPICAQLNFNIELRATLEWPDRTLAGLWGYTAADGREYALVGSSKGLIIVDVSNPDTPTQIKEIPGPESNWREVKTYKNFAFVCSEATNSLQIVDLSGLPDTNLPVKQFIGNGPSNGPLTKSHTVEIDTAKGFVYYHGGNTTATVVYDLKPDPWNPVFAGVYANLGYVHDGFVNNDTLYAAHIYKGLASVVDMSNKQAPVVLGSVTTPGLFTHSAWPSEDRKTLFVTDEKPPSFLSAYDISDPTDIEELDRLALHDNGQTTLIHNIYVRDGFVFASWYADGIAIIDALRPDNLVPVGVYDTWLGPNTIEGKGCWDVYPYFASHTLISSNIPAIENPTNLPGKLFVFSPNHTRACYIEGEVVDACTGLGLHGVDVRINSDNPYFGGKTNDNGVFKSGHYAAGNYTLTLTKSGYPTQQIPINLVPGEVFEFHVTMIAFSYMSVQGKVIDYYGNPLANTTVWLCSVADQIPIKTDFAGDFSEDCLPSGIYHASTGNWGTYFQDHPSISVHSNEIILTFRKGYYDDFSFPFDWIVSGNATQGKWIRSKPIGQVYENAVTNPYNDSPIDNNPFCYITGNGADSSALDDLSGGSTHLSSPTVNLSGYNNPILSLDYWLLHKSLDTSTSVETLYIGMPNTLFPGTSIIETINTNDTIWKHINVEIPTIYLPFSGLTSLHFFISEPQNINHIVEAGIDAFRITDGLVDTQQPSDMLSAQILPNPSNGNFRVLLGKNINEASQILLFDLLGKTVFETKLLGVTTDMHIDLPSGTYIMFLRNEKGNICYRTKIVIVKD